MIYTAGDDSKRLKRHALREQDDLASESFDYELFETPSAVHKKAAILAQNFSAHTLKLQWAFTLGIGLVMACFAFSTTVVLAKVSIWKLKVISDFLEQDLPTTAWVFYTGFSAVCMFVACSLAHWAPASSGSGIPLVKAFLNGNSIAGLLDMKTLVAKIVGVLCCVLAGMPAGREGPMVHTGAIISAFVTRWNPFCDHFFPLIRSTFDNPKARRDFVTLGAAAGVAAAFNAPVGGVLFALEEVSSFWTADIFWRSCCAAVIASFGLNMLTTLQSSDGTLKDLGLVLFNAADNDASSTTSFETSELFIFVVIGFVGGVMGGGFVVLNRNITICRKTAHSAAQKNGYKVTRLIEAVLTMVLISSVFFWISFGFDCTDYTSIDTLAHAHHDAEHGLYPVRHTCSNTTAYNAMATLTLNPQESVAKQLLSRKTAGYLPIPTLSVFVVVYGLCGCIAYGLFVPAGLFVPTMITGAAMGRLCGELVRTTGLYSNADPGVYALVGSAAYLGGATRMTISLVVILVELTNDIQFMMPLIIAVSVARAVGDMFSHSIYDTHIQLLGIPFLEPKPPQGFYFRSVKEVMAENVHCLPAACTVAHVCVALDTTSHNAFPVLEGKVFCGMTHRDTLLAILADLAGSVKTTPGKDKRASPLRQRKQRKSTASAVIVPEDYLPPSNALKKSDAAAVSDITIPESAPLEDLSCRSPPPPATETDFRDSDSEVKNNSDGKRFMGQKSFRRNSIARVTQLVTRTVSDEIRSRPLLLTKLMDPSPFAVHESLPLDRAYRLFTSQGLRQLAVTNTQREVVGIITRVDLADATLHSEKSEVKPE